jgi:hypothetical protein
VTDAVDDVLADVLSSSKDPLELARATIQVMARRLSGEVRGGGADGPAASQLKKALEELRRTEQGYQDMAVKSGELIQRSTAKALAGMVGARFVSALDRYETALAKQVEIWMADPEFTKLDSDVRGQRIKAWARDRSRGCRQVESEDLERWLKAEESDG